MLIRGTGPAAADNDPGRPGSPAVVMADDTADDLSGDSAPSEMAASGQTPDGLQGNAGDGDAPGAAGDTAVGPADDSAEGAAIGEDSGDDIAGDDPAGDDPAVDLAVAMPVQVQFAIQPTEAEGSAEITVGDELLGGNTHVIELMEGDQITLEVKVSARGFKDLRRSVKVASDDDGRVIELQLKKARPANERPRRRPRNKPKNSSGLIDL